MAPILRRISSGPSDWQTSANTNGFATLMIANSSSASPAAHSSPLVATTQMPKSSRGRASAGYTLEMSPWIVGPVALVRLVHECPDQLGAEVVRGDEDVQERQLRCRNVNAITTRRDAARVDPGWSRDG